MDGDGKAQGDDGGPGDGEIARRLVQRLNLQGAHGVQVGANSLQLNIFLGLLAQARGRERPALDGSPYRGLSAFRAEDAAIFFGRDKAVRQVLDRMATCLGHPGLLAVSGASGAGKSSLLRAGVIPRLEAEGLPGDEGADAASWPSIVFAPGQDPLGELAAQVASHAQADAGLIGRALAASPEGFALTARQAVLAGRDGRPYPERARLIVVVDQFEQVFTAGAGEAGQRAFIAALHAAATEPQGPHGTPAALVVLVVRADFETRCAAEPELTEAIRDRYLLTGMGRPELRRVIVGPATLAGASVDPALTEVLLAEISARQGAYSPGPAVGQGVLPLLSHALDQAWQQRAGQALTLTDYERTGGMDTAVARSAEEAYDALSPARRDIARRLFTLLTVAAPDGTDTAVPLDGASLAAGLADTEADDVGAVLEAFTAKRLLTLGADSVEITHEVLLTAWPLLRDTWLAVGRTDRVIRGALRTAAEEWTRHDEDPAYLYKGSLLETATEADGRSRTDPERYPPLLPAERTFLTASQRSARRQVRRLRRTVTGLTALTVGLAASTIVAVVLYHTASSARNTATLASIQAAQQRTLADSGALAARSEASGDTDPVMARLEAVAASHLQQSSATARYAMLAAAFLPWTAELGVPAIPPVTSVAFSPDRDLLAAGTDNGTVLLWNPASRQPQQILRSGHANPIQAVTFSGDGKVLAAVTSGDDIKLWDVTARKPTPTTLYAGNTNTLGPSVSSAGLSHNGKLLAVGMSDGTHLWNLASRRMALLRDTGNSVSSVAFSPDDKLLAAGISTLDTSSVVQLWDLSSAAPQDTPLSVANGVTSLAFGGQGSLLAAGTSNGTVQVWDVASRAPLPGLSTGSTSGVSSVAFAPRGSLLAVGTSTGATQLWDVGSRRMTDALPTDNTDSGGSLAFNRDGSSLAVGDPAGVRVAGMGAVSVVSEPRAVQPTADNSPAWAVGFSPDGHLVATGTFDGMVQLWDAVSRRQEGSFSVGNGNWVNSVVFSPDGKLLAVGTLNGTVTIWDVARQTTRATLRAGHTNSKLDVSNAVFSVAFRASGTELAVGTGHGTVELWDIAGGKAPLATFVAAGENVEVWSVRFSGDSPLLAAGTGDGRLELWDVTSRARTPQDLLPPGDASNVPVVAFSRDGGLLAADTGTSTQVWNIRTRKLVTVIPGLASAMTFSGDGSTLAIAIGQRVQLWDIRTSRQIGDLPLTAVPGPGDGFLAFSQDGTQLAVAAGNGTQLWSVPYLTNPVSYLCNLAAQPFPQDLWQSYVPGIVYQPTCPAPSPR